MKKRYQVFVSSTYDDLREERSKVMSALLSLDCIPAGMELFPAADEDAWTLIKGVIDECDFYILIVAGRYGSCDSEGMGYTEKEYRYAREKGKRIIAFLHADPGKIPQERCEREKAGRDKLEAFRTLTKEKTVKHWNSAEELALVVTSSVAKLMKQHPEGGWVRADQVPADDILTETIRLQKRVQELEGELSKLAEGPPPGSELLAQGADSVALCFVMPLGEEEPERSTTITTTWDDVLRRIARLLIESPAEQSIGVQLTKSFSRALLTDTRLASKNLDSVLVHEKTLEELRIQFRALGIVTQEIEVHESGRYRNRYFRWFLTPYGDRIVTQLLAKRRDAGNSDAAAER